MQKGRYPFEKGKSLFADFADFFADFAATIFTASAFAGALFFVFVGAFRAIGGKGLGAGAHHFASFFAGGTVAQMFFDASGGHFEFFGEAVDASCSGFCGAVGASFHGSKTFANHFSSFFAAGALGEVLFCALFARAFYGDFFLFTGGAGFASFLAISAFGFGFTGGTGFASFFAGGAVGMVVFTAGRTFFVVYFGRGATGAFFCAGFFNYFFGAFAAAFAAILSGGNTSKNKQGEHNHSEKFDSLHCEVLSKKMKIKM